ncbi:MAG: hypothetical protein JWM86_1539 [Thermoleophilia bacterium]|nr:hypothetical protein [Thermoleophilia bacterium]
MVSSSTQASDEFDPRDERLRPTLELAAERRAVVLVHIELARQYPGARFVLGHVPAESLFAACTAASELPNLWVCLSWWGPLDVSYALQWVPPERLVHGSDPPYGHAVTGLAQTVLVERAPVGGRLHRCSAGRYSSTNARPGCGGSPGRPDPVSQCP